MMKKRIRVVSVFLVAMLLTACVEAAPGEQGPFVWPESVYGETLTVAVLGPRFERIAGEFELRNPGVTIELIEFEHLDVGREQIAMEIMAGNVPTLTLGDFVDYHHPLTAQYFADWLPIMHSNPNFDENDWFMNVFYALARDGRLMGFPMSYDMSVGNSFYVANSTVPGLAEEFAGRQGISTNELMEIYERISATTGTNMHMERSFDVLQAVEDNIGRFFDFETRRVQFGSREFIDFIAHAREITSPRRNFGTMQFFNFGEIGNREVTLALSHQYMFRRITISDMDNFGAFEGDLVFVNPLAYTNDRGELLISPDMTWALSASASHAQQALALELLRFAIVPPVYREEDIVRHRLLVSSTSASPARGHARSTFEHSFTWATSAFHFTQGWRYADGGWHVAIDALVAYAEAASEMPMHDTRYAPEFVRDALRQILHEFHDGLITAEQAANDLQNRITLIIMEMG